MLCIHIHSSKFPAMLLEATHAQRCRRVSRTVKQYQIHTSNHGPIPGPSIALFAQRGIALSMDLYIRIYVGPCPQSSGKGVKVEVAVLGSRP